MISPERLISLIQREAQKVFDRNRVVVQYAFIDPSYSGGRPRLLFDGEDDITLKGYPYLSSYTPQASERVMLINGVIQGAIL